MFKRIEKQILDFVDTLPGIKMREVTHGTLYVTLEEDRDCDSIQIIWWSHSEATYARN